VCGPNSVVGVNSAPDAVDSLKLAWSMAAVAEAEFAAQHEGSPELAAEAVLARLRGLGELLSAAAAGCDPGGDPSRYSTGHKVMSAFQLSGGRWYLHRWHPDPAHDMNRPGQESTVVLPDGRTMRVIVNGLGFLDSLTPTAAGVQPARVE
jgi:hypothetical protein